MNEVATARAGLDPDWELLRRSADGDTTAFEPLVERHERRLLTLCERLLGDREEARDAAQEVFLKAFRAADRARPEGLFFTWLYRIGVNHCLNRLRRHRLVRFLPFAWQGDEEEGGGVPFEPASNAPGPAEELAARERWAATRRAIAKLPESQRVVLVLARFEALPQREIARLLGITEGAVESRLVRAMRRLVAAAAQEEGGSGVSGKERGS